MPLYRPSELHQVLKQYGSHAKKSLSQNFLIDGNVVRKIVHAIPYQPGESIFEIGPGPGALTEQLLTLPPSFYLAVEKDHQFAKHLTDTFGHQDNCSIIEGDVLKESWESLLCNRHVHVVGNLPYQITSPILRKIAEHKQRVLSATVMVQEEVGRRITASCGGKDYGLLSIGMQFDFTTSYCFSVSNQCFMPPPKVQSCIIQLIPKKAPLDLSEREAFFSLTRLAFQNRRKALRSSLRKAHPTDKVEEVLKKMDKPPLTRPEELSLEEWVSFFRMVKG